MASDAGDSRLFRLIKPTLITAGMCLVLGGIIHMASLADIVTTQEVKQYLHEQGMFGWFVLMTVATIAMGCGFPRQVVAFIGGALVGASLGALVSTLLCAVACALTFWLSRLLMRTWVQHRFPGFILRVGPLMERKPFVTTIAIRLLPAGSNVLTNLVAGVTTIKARHFVLASTLGYIPQMLIFALMGSGLRKVSGWQLGLSFALFVIAFVLGVYLYRWYQKELKQVNTVGVS